MSKHTPGPWSWWTSCSFRRLSARNDGDVLHAVIQRSDGHPDIRFPNGGPEGPDARLIAAAPDLLEALRELADDIDARFDMGSASTNPNLRHAVTSARAAIAKATGETQ